MRYDRAIVLSDLDGTLFNSRGEVSAEDRAAVSEFIAAGGLFGIATGREPHNALGFLTDLGLNAPSVVLNGAAVYDFGARRYLSTTPLDREAAAELLRRCEALPLDIQVYTPEGIFYTRPLESVDPGFLGMHRPCSYLPPERLSDRAWLKLLLLEREAGALAPMRSFMRERGLERRLNLVEGTTDIVKTGKYQELLPQGVTKGSAVGAIRAQAACAGRTVFALGDYWNDLELLRAVDVPCAPDNAIDEVKAVCRHILPSHNDSPAAWLIRRVIPAL